MYISHPGWWVLGLFLGFLAYGALMGWIGLGMRRDRAEIRELDKYAEEIVLSAPPEPLQNARHDIPAAGSWRWPVLQPWPPAAEPVNGTVRAAAPALVEETPVLVPFAVTSPEVPEIDPRVREAFDEVTSGLQNDLAWTYKDGSETDWAFPGQLGMEVARMCEEAQAYVDGVIARNRQPFAELVYRETRELVVRQRVNSAT